MFTRFAYRACLPLLACVLALLAQALGTHVHLCLDGSEPPMSVHASVAGDHADHHGDEPHQDIDLMWAAESVVKSPHALPIMPPVLLAVVWVCLLGVALATRRFCAPAPQFSPSFFLQRPPPRGPPRFSR
jgi:hypothetical protein